MTNYDACQSKGEGVIVADMSRTAARAAKEAGSIASAVGRHALWYVRYQLDGTVRARREGPPVKRSSER